MDRRRTEIVSKSGFHLNAAKAQPSFDCAITSCKQAIARSLTFQAQFSLFKALIHLGKVEDAAKAIARILEKDPKDVDALALQSDVLWAQGKKEEAVSFLNENLVSYYPKEPTIRRKTVQFLLNQPFLS